ncbi:GTPase IMAP family member 4 (Immunity-associated nucleotide 1 protein) (IAN-1) (Immunity-associated protein 4), partial [Durusdinium trenchii]
SPNLRHRPSESHWNRFKEPLDAIFVSKTGAGKSSTINSMNLALTGAIGSREVGSGMRSCTTEHQREEMCDGKLVLHDIPGTMDTEGRDAQFLTKLHSLNLSLNVVVFVLPFGKATEEELQVLRIAANMFGGAHRLAQRIVVCVTKGDILTKNEDEARQQVRDFVSQGLGELVPLERVVVVTNHPQNQMPSGRGRIESANELMESISFAVAAQEGRKFTPESIFE